MYIGLVGFATSHEVSKISLVAVTMILHFYTTVTSEKQVCALRKEGGADYL